MSTRQLPARPNLEHLKKQARLLLRESLEGDAAAAERFREPVFNFQQRSLSWQTRCMRSPGSMASIPGPV